jgi:hypothetical protein
LSGQQIGTAVGFVAGFFLPGGPQVWAAIGGMVGGAISPTEIRGPHIGDGQNQSSAEGVPIPWIMGTAGFVQGNIVDKGPRREVKKEDDGKGSSTVAVTYEAHQDFTIMICESSETRDSLMTGVLIVRLNGKIVYDMRPESNFAAENSKFLRNHTFYDGNESQGVDPTEEAWPTNGVGNTPYYRGVYRMVARDINLSQYGDAIPTYEFVMIGAGSSDDTITTTLIGPRYSRFQNESWPLVDAESQYTYQGAWTSGDGAGHTSPSFDTIAEVQQWAAGLNAEDGTAGTNSLGTPSTYIGYIANTSGGAGAYNGTTVTFSGVAAQYDVTDLTALYLLYQFLTPENGYEDVSPAGFCSLTTAGGQWQGARNGMLLNKAISPTPPQYLSVTSCGGSEVTIGIYPLVITVARKLPPPTAAPIGDPCVLGVPVALPDSPGFVIDCAGVISPEPVITTVSGSYLILQKEVVASIDGRSQYEQYTVGPILEIGDPDSTEEFWEAAYDAAVLAGTVEAGLVYGVDYPVAITSAYESTITTTATTTSTIGVATAITRVVKRGGLTEDDIDVADVDPTLRGYAIQQAYNGTECLSPLLFAYTLYGSEYDAQLHFHKHGADIEITVDPDDFIDNGDESDTDTRDQAIEYPRKISVGYIDPDQNYEARPQSYQRTSPDVRAIGDESTQTSVVMDADKAKQLAVIGIKVAWARAQGFREFSLPYSGPTICYLPLVAGMPFGLDGKRWVVSEMTTEDGEIKIKALYDRQSAYVSNATGVPALPPTAPPSNIGGVTLFAAMNLPRLRSSENVPGMHLAFAGLLTSWPGCQLQMSVDDGETWLVPIASATQQSVIGYLTAAVGDAPSDTLSVTVHGGTMSSVTEAQIANRANAAAVLTAGVAEILQFQDADEVTQDNYDLTTLTRGGLGTAAVPHATGDRFVLLNSPYFLPLDISLAGKTILFRPVTFGTLPDNNAIYAAVFQPQFTGPQVSNPLTVGGEQVTVDGAPIYVVT